MIKKASFLALVSCAVFSASCYAGQYAQALGDCVYDNLSREDKNVMTQWAFVTLGKTDAAKQITVIPESKNKQVNKEALANLLNPGTANVLRGAEVLKGFFKKPQ